MIEEVNRKLAEIADPQYPKVEGWKEFPAPEDVDYPVPPPYSLGNPETDARLREIKSDEHLAQTFRPREQQLQDENFLRGVTLGELGARVEFPVHNWAHMRWSVQPESLRPDPDPADPMAVDEKWDDPSYEWLGDFYSSHVNPLFWTLHGWVDGRIDAWMAANGITGEYQWKGTWSGPIHHHLAVAAGAEPAPGLANTEELLKVAAGAGVVTSPFAGVDL